jgi:hypothetical protein
MMQTAIILKSVILEIKTVIYMLIMIYLFIMPLQPILNRLRVNKI